MSFFCLGLSVHNSPLSLSSAPLAELCGTLEFRLASSRTVGARLPPPFAFDRFFRRNSGVDAGIIEIRIVIPPTVVILFRDFASLQFGGLLLPGTEALLKICGFGAAVKYVGTKADQPIGILNADQFPIFQRKQCVHQSIYGVHIRNRDFKILRL